MSQHGDASARDFLVVDEGSGAKDVVRLLGVLPAALLPAASSSSAPVFWSCLLFLLLAEAWVESLHLRYGYHRAARLSKSTTWVISACNSGHNPGRLQAIVVASEASSESLPLHEAVRFGDGLIFVYHMLKHQLNTLSIS